MTRPIVMSTHLAVASLTGLTLLEKRLVAALGPVAESVSIRSAGRTHPADVRWGEFLAGADLLVIGPDLAFAEALAAAGAAAAAAPRVPIVFVRGETDVAHVRAAAEAGARGYLPFPFEDEAFRAHLEGLLRGAPLDAMRVGDISDPFDWREALREFEPVGRAAERIAACGRSGLPVVDRDGKAIGFVSTKDLLAAYRLRGPEAGHLEARNVMSRRVIALDENATVDDAVDLFARHSLRLAPVLRDGRPVGLLDRLVVLRAVVEAVGRAGGRTV